MPTPPAGLLLSAAPPGERWRGLGGSEILVCRSLAYGAHLAGEDDSVGLTTASMEFTTQANVEAVEAEEFFEQAIVGDDLGGRRPASAREFVHEIWEIVVR